MDQLIEKASKRREREANALTRLAQNNDEDVDNETLPLEHMLMSQEELDDEAQIK